MSRNVTRRGMMVGSAAGFVATGCPRKPFATTSCPTRYGPILPAT